MSAGHRSAAKSPDFEFSLERFEYLVYGRQREAAMVELSKLLRLLEVGFGELGNIGSRPGNAPGDLRDAHVASRIAGAVATLFSDPQLELSDSGFQALIPMQRWLAMIFGASPLGTADHIIRLLNREGYARRDQMTFTGRDLLRFCLLFGPDSQIPIEPEALWRKSRRLAATVFLALLSPRIVLTDQAHAKREFLLEWLRPKLRELPLDDFPLDILHTWMSCSYADRPDKHAIKREINDMVRRRLLSANVLDVPAAPAPSSAKPVLLCILEWFNSGHAMYRGFSLAIGALKSRYRLVGVSLRDAADERARSLFDEVHVIPAGSPWQAAQQVRNLAATLRPAIAYYPSVGMFLETILLVSLRLAPIQMTSLGHPATTHSPFMDYVLVPQDSLGDPACFSERVVALPPAAVPSCPPANAPRIKPQIRSAPDPVRVAVAATSMKLNPRFLRTLEQIARQAKARLEFHFFSGMARGLTKVYLQNLINRFLPGFAVVYPHLTYQSYIENVNRCDMFLDPFPFGNTNGIVDTVRQGLAGVCLTGPEVHSHIDEALFRRLGLPEWLIARTPEEYVSAAVRLADGHAEREALGRAILKTDPDAKLFSGDPALFAKAVEWIELNHARHVADDVRLLRPPGADRKPVSARKKKRN